MVENKRSLHLDSITIEKNKRIEYDYRYDPYLSKYFSPHKRFFAEFDIDISEVPHSLLTIPWLANVLPIAWFAGANIYVDETDESFFLAQEKIRKEFQRNYPELDTQSAGLVANRLVKNFHAKERSAMLFSGGIDTYATYFRQADKSLDLITVIGADMPIDDFPQRDRVLRLNNAENLITTNEKFVITSNLREFYTYKVDLLLPDLGWWGKVQHGMALTGLLAPLSYVRKHAEEYIASSYNDHCPIVWGSTPNIDNQMAWANVEVIHDGYELERSDKIELIVTASKRLGVRPKLRVCYSELNQEVNCSNCEKCVRSAFGIMLANDDPNLYGFKFSENIFEKAESIFSAGFNSQGTWYFWKELMEKFKAKGENVYLYGLKLETPSVQRVLKFNMSSTAPTHSDQRRVKNRLKFKLMNRFPRMFAAYLWIRRRIL